MTLGVIPALDVSGGRLVRIAGPGAVPVKAFGGDPAEAARTFLRAGAEWLHVVDVERAIAGGPPDLRTLRAVAATGARIQASGGIGSQAEVEEILAAGAGRVVLGSHALRDRDALERTVVALGGGVVVGIEVRAGAIHPRGGGHGADLPLMPTLAWLSGLPAQRILCTAIGRVGGLEGSDAETIGLVAREAGRPVIAAGGIRGPQDVRLLATVPGVEAVVIGRALYEGLDLRSAMEAASTA